MKTKNVCLSVMLSLLASFCAWSQDTLAVKDVTFARLTPKSGLIGIDCTVDCSDPEAIVDLTVSAKDTVTGKALAVNHIWRSPDHTHTNALAVKSGSCHLIWDAKTDNPNFYSDSVTVSVQASINKDLYMVVDLSDGPDAEQYPVSYLDAVPEDGWNDVHKTTSLVLRRIEAGSFVMGSPESELGREPNETQHSVTLSSPYYIGIFELTQTQYAYVTTGSPAAFPGGMRPVEQVSFDDIRGSVLGTDWPADDQVDDDSFMGLLRARTSLRFDLPTSAMWEYACRADTVTALNNGTDLASATQDDNLSLVGRYLFNQMDAQGNFTNKHTTVGSYLPNAWGLYDMHGNVWEWCLDWYANQAADAVTDPAGADSGPGRVIRGGSWGDNADHCRSGYFGGNTPENRHHGIGFRASCPAPAKVSAQMESEPGPIDFREASPALAVENVAFAQRDDASGLADITCTVTCNDPNADIRLTIMATDTVTGKKLTVERVWQEDDPTQTFIQTVKNGVYHFVWDAKSDNPDFHSDSVSVSVQAAVSIDNGLYMVIDLSGGPDTEQYPVTYLDAEPEGGWTEEYKTTKLVLRRIDAGTFIMGLRATDLPFSWANGLHEVTITQPFRMGVFQVTQKQFEQVMGTRPSEFTGEMRPVETVSWNTIRGDSATYDWPTAGSSVDENSFMGKLRTKTGIDSFDLPTEAVWEYACRAGTTTALNSGKNLESKSKDAAMDEVGRYGYNNGFISGNPDGIGGYDDHHTTVGSYLPNAWGLYDMHGNVWEWCLDWWDPNFSDQPVTDPPGPNTGSVRLLRGGSWHDDADTCRSGLRGGVAPDNGTYNCGFRVSSGLLQEIGSQANSEAMPLDLREPPLTITVGDVIFAQRDDASGLVDLTCTVTCGDPDADIRLAITATDTATGNILTVKHIWSEDNPTQTFIQTVKSGTHHFVWDARTDNPGLLSDSVTISVRASIGGGLYMVIDLSGGPDAAQYPVTYLDAEPEGGWTGEYKTDKLVLRRIEAGTFVMGHQASDYPTSWANMLHEVTISKPFCIGVFEVTQKQYESIMGATPSEFSGKMRPVESVSWNAIRGDTQVYDWPTAGSSVDENSFMGKLRAKTGIDTFDLPTEAKWEYACRAGTTTALNSGKNMAGKEWDPAMDEVGRYGYNNGFISGNPDGIGGYDDHHTTVGSYLPNAWGLYDMHGNVWEWCLDWWRDDFSSQAATDPEGPLGGTSRLLRGGSWYDSADCCRSGYRGGVPPNHEGNNCGLRVSCAAGAGSSVSAQAESESERIDLRQGIMFSETEVAVNEGELIRARIFGGNADQASSVKVYLTYNTATATDLDLKAGTVNSVEGVIEKQGLTFPLTLSWAAGEIGEKRIVIPTKSDRSIEADETLTLQLTDPVTETLGELNVCTVTITDANDKTLTAAVTPYKPKANESVTTNHVTVTGTEGGFVAGTGDYTAGTKVTLTAEPRPGWSFAGWRTADDPSAPYLSTNAKYPVVVSGDADYVAAFERIPYVRGLAVPADGGKVSGSALCAKGQRVTLRAAAAKNFTFGGWYKRESDTFPVATTPTLVIDRTAKPLADSGSSTTVTNAAEDVTYFAKFIGDPHVTVTLLDSAGENDAAGSVTGAGRYPEGKTVTLKASAGRGNVFAGWESDSIPLPENRLQATLTFVMPAGDVAVTARFVTAEEDQAAITLGVDGTAMETETAAIWTNLCGVAVDWPVTSGGLSETTVKAAGLPAGLKLVQDKATKAYSIAGVPTAPSRVNAKTGEVTPSPVRLTVTTAGRSSQTYAIDLFILPLPDWVAGTFTGIAQTTGGDCGSATLTVTSAGKISGKVALLGTNWTFSATGLGIIPADESSISTNESAFAISADLKAGKELLPFALTLKPDSAPGADGVALLNALAAGQTQDGVTLFDLRRNIWKDKATLAAAKAVVADWTGVYTLALQGEGFGDGYLSLTVDANGAVKASGKLPDGTAVSASSTLVYAGERDGFETYLYLAPSAYKGGAFALRVGFPEAKGPLADFGNAYWVNRNPLATEPYGMGFALVPSFFGAYYNKLATLHAYYDTLSFATEKPLLAYTRKETDLDETTHKKVTTATEYKGAPSETLTDCLLAVNEKGTAFIVEKATKPVKEAETGEWIYEGANDGALTFSFTAATGIFKGTFTFWYDYLSAYDAITGKETVAHTSKKVNYEGIMVQGQELSGFYLWNATGSYEDEKTGKTKTFSYKQSFPVRFVPASCGEEPLPE